MTRALEDEIRSTADHFPAGHIETLAAAFANAARLAAGGVVPGLPTPLIREQAKDLVGRVEGQTPVQIDGAAIALALRVAGATARAIRGEMTVSQSGPDRRRPEMSVRLSRAAP